MRWIGGSLAVLLAGLWLSPASASACSCVPWVTLAWPQEKISVPEGSLLLLDLVCGVEPLLVYNVRVDGEPVTLVDGPAYGLRLLEPSPAVGQEVQARVCTETIDDEDLCDDVTFLIEQSAPVGLEPPALMLEHQWQQSGCPASWEWTVRIVLDGREANAGRPVVYAVDVGDQLDALSAVVPDGSRGTDQNVAAAEPGQEMCVTVRAYDVWGAQAEPTTACIEVEPAPDVDCADPLDDPRTCPTQPSDDEGSESSTTGDSGDSAGEESGSTTPDSTSSGTEPEAQNESSQAGCRAAQPPHMWWLVVLAGLLRRRKHLPTA